jgi:ADP-heptose:LPS heptosyltransferase
MIELPEITMICADTKNPGAAISAIRKSLSHIKPARTIFFTDKHYDLPGIETIFIPTLNSKRSYSYFICKELYKHIETSHILIIQADGYILDHKQWDDKYLNYDLIGAAWPYDHDRRIANGGFSLRTKRLQEIVGTDDFIDVVHPEDQSISIIYKLYLEEKYGIKFAPEELAEKFSFELIEPNQQTFGFHQYHWPPYHKTIVIRRWASLGDVCMTEPILHYYWQKGYRVIIDTLPQFYELFRNHYFPVEYYEHFNKKVKHEYLNLDMSYESDPRKLHLKAYYEFSGVPESEQVIRNPRLNVVVDKSNTLFPQKFVVLHLDKRSQPGRNQYGIDWSTVVRHLSQKGYLVIQIGKGESDEIEGAIRMNTLAEPMMVYLLAGCEVMIAVDSGPANVAVALDKKLIVFHGSVSPHYIWPDMSKIKVITNHKEENPICNNVYCWSSTVGCEGVKCYISEETPPCTQFTTQQVLSAINELI